MIFFHKASNIQYLKWGDFLTRIHVYLEQFEILKLISFFHNRTSTSCIHVYFE
jgi:hypothetical protein